MRGVPATLDSSPRTPPSPVLSVLLQPRRSALDHMRKAGATIFIGDPVASVRVFAKLAVKPKATAFFYTYIGNGGDVPLTR